MTEAAIDGPRLVDAEEFSAVLALVDRCFNHEPGGMRESNPHCYDPDHPERHAVVERDGRIVSHVACIPTTLVVGDAEIETWGISGVATDPRYRGNGYMSRLVEFWLDRMTETEVPLSQLWGNRQRYGRFGWETAGREHAYRLTRRSVPNSTDNDDRDDRDDHVERYDGTDAHADLVGDRYRRKRHRVARTDEDVRTVLGQRGLETLVHTEAGSEAYLAFAADGRERTVQELGGDPRGVRALLEHLFRAYYTTEVTAYVSPSDPLCEVLTELSADWTAHTHKKLNVRRLAPVLDAFTGQMARRWSRFGGDGSMILAIEGRETGARVAWTDESVTVEAVDEDPDVVLDRRAITRLLFGFDGQLRPVKIEHPFLDAVCPLDFHVPRSQWV